MNALHDSAHREYRSIPDTFLNRTATGRAFSLSLSSHIVVFLFTFLLIFSRRPDALLRAQFYAEDGAIWFHDAYTFGWAHALFLPYNGYMQLLPRLVAGLALLVPFQFAPLVMNVVGIALQAMLVNFLLSAETAGWAPFRLRVLWACAYIALPNSSELHATITEGQWHLALLACILALSPPVVNRPILRIVPLCLIALSGLTGPFCLVLLPITIVAYYIRREPSQRIVIATLAISSAIQLWAIVTTAGSTRSHAPLGANATGLLTIVAGRVYLAALLGKFALAAQRSLASLVAIGVIGSTIMVYCVWRCTLELRLLILFCVTIFSASLLNPMVSLTTPQWSVLSAAPGIHYWFLPMIAFIWSLLWCFTLAQTIWVKRVSAALLALMCVGIARDWNYPRQKDEHYAAQAARFAAARVGSVVEIPIFPEGWTVRLRKKDARERDGP